MEFIENYSGLFIYPILSIFFSLVFTGLCIRILPCLGYVDTTGGQNINGTPIPRGGGIAVFFAFFITFALYVLESHNLSAGLSLFRRLFWPALLLCGLGLAGDRTELRTWQKLLVQMIVVLIIWHTGNRRHFLPGWELSGFISFFFLFFWVMIIVNVFKLIDGLDGLASGVAVIFSVCMAICFLMAGGYLPEAVCMLILAGACLGFLRYNFYPARIFLGNTGSTFLGLFFAIIGLSLIDDKAVTLTSLLLPLLAIGVPLFDMMLTIRRCEARKLLDSKSNGITDGNQERLHYRLFRQTKKQTATAFIMIQLLIDFFMIALSSMITCAILIGAFRDFTLFLYASVPVVLLLCFFGIYHIYWFRAGLNNYWQLAVAIMAGSLFSCILIYCYCYESFRIFDPMHLRCFIGGCLMFTLLNLTLICVERFLIHCSEGFLFRKLCLQYQDSSKIRRVVIYGGGLNCRIYINYLFTAHHRELSESVIGILDDDPGLTGLEVYGFQVFGASDQIEQIHKLHPFEKLVVATDSAPLENLVCLHRFCKEKGIEFTKIEYCVNKVK